MLDTTSYARMYRQNARAYSQEVLIRSWENKNSHQKFFFPDSKQSTQMDLLQIACLLPFWLEKRIKTSSGHFHGIYPAEGSTKSKENISYWMDSGKPTEQNSLLLGLPFHHLKCWKVNVDRDKSRCFFIWKWRASNIFRGTRSFKRPALNKTPVFLATLLFSQATEKEHLEQQEAQAFARFRSAVLKYVPV